MIEVIIDENTILSATANIIAQPTSGASNGEVEIEVFNGSTNYTFDWPDGPGPGIRDDLAAGLYTVTVTDLGVTGCMVEVTFILTNDGPDVTIHHQW